MYIARLLYPVKTLGPGNRLAIWMSGCSRACKGCANPELWTQRLDQFVTADNLAVVVRALAANHVVDGLTITGGEPLEQLDELAVFLEKVKDIKDVLIYTGYRLSDLSEEKTRILAACAAAVIDGEYREDLNEGKTLTGSTNQVIHFFRSELQPIYEDYQNEIEKRVQRFDFHDGSSILAGITTPGSIAKLNAVLVKKGVVPR